MTQPDLSQWTPAGGAERSGDPSPRVDLCRVCLLLMLGLLGLDHYVGLV